MKTKTKIVYVTPISNKARGYFNLDMSKLHSCRVMDENDTMFYLESINKEHYFWVKKLNDKNWMIEK